MNYIWLLVVAGAAAALGVALAFGMLRQDPKRFAPVQSGDWQHAEERLPAGPVHNEELPGRNQTGSGSLR